MIKVMLCVRFFFSFFFPRILYQNIFCYSPLKQCSRYTLWFALILNRSWRSKPLFEMNTDMTFAGLRFIHLHLQTCMTLTVILLVTHTHSLHPSCYRLATPVVCWQQRHQSWHCHSHRWWLQHPLWDLTAPALWHVHHQCLCQHPGSAFCVVWKCLRSLFCVVPVTEVIHFRAESVHLSHQ